MPKQTRLLLLSLLCTLLGCAHSQAPAATPDNGAAAAFGDGSARPPPPGEAPPGEGEFGDVAAFFGASPPAGPALPFGVSLAPAGEGARLKYQGTGTISFDPQPIQSTGAVNYACSLGWISPAFHAAYVGVGSSFYNQGYACGQCIKIRCDDAACANPGKELVANVVDVCGDCFDADIRIAQPLFQNLTGSAGPSAQISWQWVPCGGLLQGNIKMLQKPGGTAFYQAFSFANSQQPIIAVRMNGQLLKHSQSGNWWEWNPGQAINPRGPFKLDLLAQNKQVLSVSLPQLRSLDLGVQFRTA